MLLNARKLLFFVVDHQVCFILAQITMMTFIRLVFFIIFDYESVFVLFLLIGVNGARLSFG